MLVPFIAICVPAMVWRLRRRGQVTAPRLVTGLLVCAYAAAVLDEVLLPDSIRATQLHDDVPWHVWMNLVPFGSDDLYGMWLNLLLFVPLGMALPLLFAGISARRAVLIGFLVSLSIEVLQILGDLTISSGRVFDIDDLVSNTLGALAGYVLVRALLRIPALARQAARFTWPVPAPREVSAAHR